MKLKNFAKKVGFEIVGKAKKTNNLDDWKKSANSYRIVLTHKNKKFAVDFWQGPAIKNPPTREAVLHCLQFDASIVFDSPTFHSFCDAHGYNNDSIRDLGIFKACKKMHAVYKNFLV